MSPLPRRAVCTWGATRGGSWLRSRMVKNVGGLGGKAGQDMSLEGQVCGCEMGMVGMWNS